jgi:MFS family permease
MPAWMDVVAGAIPTTLRGRFFAFAGVGASLAGLGAGLVTAWLLAAVPAPRSYGLCFLLCALFMAVSYAALTSVRERPVPAGPPAMSMRGQLGRVPSILRGDANLAWYLAARACAAVGTMAGGFYTVYAITTLGAPAWQAGVFTTFMIAGKIAGDLTLGWVADHLGHRLVLIAGVAATVAGNALALWNPSVERLGVVFALLGVHFAANNVSGLNVLLEFAPSASERPTYIGLGLTTVAPLAFAAPLVAGLVADAWGFPAVFMAAGVFGMAALTLYLTQVRDPRHLVATSHGG